MTTITITRFRPYDTTKQVEAFFDCELDLSDGLRVTLYGLKLVRAKDGSLFVACAQTKSAKSDKYFSNYYLSSALNEQLLTLAEAKLSHSAVA
jgi:hypothetical protein